MRILAAFIYMAYIYGAAWVLASGNVLHPSDVNTAVLMICATLILLSILPPVKFLHTRYALFTIAGFSSFKRPNPLVKKELLSIWSEVVKSCGYNPKRFRVIVYPSKPNAWPHVTDNTLLLPDGFVEWARTQDGQAILVHEIGHLVHDRTYTLLWLFYGAYKLALLPISLLRFVWGIAANMPLVNLIAIPVLYTLQGVDYVLAHSCTYINKQAQWRSEYRADQFAAAHGFAAAAASAIIRYGEGNDTHGSYTHPPGAERVRRLQTAVQTMARPPAK
ncbi:MAG: M48 family metalloprotease [Dethiobacter sp.]|nr:M48 family metalloprotease [Dethiobacter sp.]